MKSLVWLRSDLRLNDNPALMAACKNHEEVHAVYIFSKNQFNSHNESNVKVDFIISNLFHLEKSLRELNIPLTVINSSGFEEDPQAIFTPTPTVFKDLSEQVTFFNQTIGANAYVWNFGDGYCCSSNISINRKFFNRFYFCFIIYFIRWFNWSIYSL